MGDEVCADPLEQRSSGIKGGWGDASNAGDGSWTVLEGDTREVRQ